MFQLIIGEQHLLRLLFESRKLRLLFKIWQKKRKRLTQRDEKIDGLYIELRKEQEEKIDWIHKCHEVELIQKESEVKKCEIRGCVKRMPPSDY